MKICIIALEGFFWILFTMMKLNKSWLRFPQTADANRVSVNNRSCLAISSGEDSDTSPDRRDVLKWLICLIRQATSSFENTVLYIIDGIS